VEIQPYVRPAGFSKAASYNEKFRGGAR
jgi:hypothetical protein